MQRGFHHGLLGRLLVVVDVGVIEAGEDLGLPELLSDPHIGGARVRLTCRTSRLPCGRATPVAQRQPAWLTVWTT